MAFVKAKQLSLYTQGAPVTVATSAAETTVISTTGSGGLEVLKNSMTVGKTYRIQLAGYYSNTGTPTLDLKVKFGTTVLLDTGVLTTATGATNREFMVDGLITVYTVGSSGAVRGQGLYLSPTETILVNPMINTSNVTVDTTANNTFNVTIQWGTSSSSNTITVTNLVIEELN